MYAVTRDRGPEEFFEVFREVQSGRKGRPESDAQPDGEAEPTAPSETQPAGSPAWTLPETVEVSFVVAAAFVAGALLLIVGSYMLGRQQGWRAHAAAVAPPGPQEGPAPGTGTPATPASDAPELVDGKVFTLVTYGKARQHRQWAQMEADYLNALPRFQALSVQAYPYRDRSGTHRLCVRGLAAKSAAERGTVKARIRALKSRAGKPEYSDADFYAP